MSNQNYEPVFDENELKTVQYHISKYPKPMAAVMPVLWMIQNKYGWISTDAMKYVGDLLGLPHDHVLGVATFYTMYFKKPMGRHHLQICTNVSCMLRGGYDIFDHVSGKLNIRNKEITDDKMFSIEEVECLGSCGTAPMLQVNNREYYENLTVESVDKLIEDLRNR
ncbi:MAG TPA: NAD(P)H-dependent oxidoreductase subunit E [Ignavibacteria bacterium]|nr:NAD(P)H-dependent oxidoreductase subunit E [Ignavibacteria bacterium]HMR39109.1 NAD(P)H-dependent oxidoreductase subunit E [Ignavibacteria bacterium]